MRGQAEYRARMGHGLDSEYPESCEDESACSRDADWVITIDDGDIENGPRPDGPILMFVCSRHVVEYPGFPRMPLVKEEVR